jgi:hypothetical protein
MFSKIPTAPIKIKSEVPPALINGNTIPVGGIDEVTTAI